MSKTAKRRDCPALGREISAAECGDGRISRVACPPTCPHNPFAPANYDQVLQIEERVGTKAFDWLNQNYRHRDALNSDLKRALASKHPSLVSACIGWHLFLAEDAEGLTCAARWERQGFPGLKNDERVLFRSQMQSRMALLEVHRILDDRRLEVVDLLEEAGAPFVVCDRSLAARIARFATLVAWIHPLPHFWRLGGVAPMFGDMGPLDPPEVVRHLVAHLGGPTDTPALRRWLAEHALRFTEALYATAFARRKAMFASLDAVAGRAMYRLERSFEECRAALDAVTDLDREPLQPNEESTGFTEARVWFERDEEDPVKLGTGRAVLGRVLLGPRFWRLEVLGAGRLARMRERFEAALGDRLRFVSESQDDLAARFQADDPAFDAALVPPALLEDADRLVISSARVEATPDALSPADALRRRDQLFLDEAIPALDGKTPRAAVADPLLRPKLVRLLKQRVRAADERNLTSGEQEDVNWMIQELGLTEILFDPPPPRPRLRSAEDEDEQAPPETAAATLPLPPPLPDRPWTLDEAIERLCCMDKHFKRIEDAVADLAASGSTLVDDLLSLGQRTLKERESAYLALFGARLSYAFAPPGTRPPPSDYGTLTAALQREIERGQAAAKDERSTYAREFYEAGPQPDLMRLLTAEVIASGEKTPPLFEPGSQAQFFILLVLKVLVAEFDAALRRQPRPA